MEKVRKNPISIDEWIEENIEDDEERLKIEKIKTFSKIASEIIKYRIDHNLSQADLAKKLGVSQNQVSKWERGMNDFKIGTLVEICKKLGLELEVNLGVIKDENEKEESQMFEERQAEKIT